MLKTVSSITNAIGALNYKGTWDANANSPALTSSVGTKGDYYVVGTAGSTNLNGISNWGVGDWAAYNGSVWQRVEGGANLNGVDLSVSGTSTLSGLTASTALALNGSKQVVSVTNTGTGNNVLASSPTVVAPTVGPAGNFTDSYVIITQSGFATGGQSYQQFKDANGLTGAINSWGSAYGGVYSLAIGISSNVLNDSSLGGTLKYGQNGFANMYRQYAGEHIFWSAASGTGGNNISFATPLILDINNNTKPGADNVYSSGTAANRWSVVYAGTGTINTSDARTKQQVRDLDEAERRVAQKIKGLLKTFKFNDAVQAKGDGARIHFGVIAQDVAASFASEGLDASRYALFCHDTWEDQYQDEIVAEQSGTDPETGEPIYKNRVVGQKLVQAAGDRYGIRYDQLLAFMIAAI
jgi:hypothetical protein